MEKSINILVIGNKDFENYTFFEKKMYEVLDFYFKNNYIIRLREREINQIDNFVILFSKENNCILERCKIDWNKYGKSAAFENIKQLIYGNKDLEGIDILINFETKKKDEWKDRIVEEFRSVLNLNVVNNFFTFREE